jgi:UDP-N-acetyl-2-amino-2-deoxyglucuronate dehydrogenase
MTLPYLHTLEFSSGVISTLDAATSIYPGYARRIELTGSEGTLVLEHDRIITADLRRPLDEQALGANEDTNGSVTPSVVSDVRGHRRTLEKFFFGNRKGWQTAL